MNTVSFLERLRQEVEAERVEKAREHHHHEASHKKSENSNDKDGNDDEDHIKEDEDEENDENDDSSSFKLSISDSDSEDEENADEAEEVDDEGHPRPKIVLRFAPEGGGEQKGNTRTGLKKFEIVKIEHSEEEINSGYLKELSQNTAPSKVYELTQERHSDDKPNLMQIEISTRSLNDFVRLMHESDELERAKRLFQEKLERFEQMHTGNSLPPPREDAESKKLDSHSNTEQARKKEVEEQLYLSGVILAKKFIKKGKKSLTRTSEVADEAKNNESKPN